MKKTILMFFTLLSVFSLASDKIISELKGLNAEYEDLVKEEEARFQKEKELSERAVAQNIKLAELKASIEEKLLAALSHDIKEVLIPKGNEKDIAELPDIVKEGLIITPVKTMDEVLAKALV